MYIRDEDLPPFKVTEGADALRQAEQDAEAYDKLVVDRCAQQLRESGYSYAGDTQEQRRRAHEQCLATFKPTNLEERLRFLRVQGSNSRTEHYAGLVKLLRNEEYAESEKILHELAFQFWTHPEDIATSDIQYLMGFYEPAEGRRLEILLRIYSDRRFGQVLPHVLADWYEGNLRGAGPEYWMEAIAAVSPADAIKQLQLFRERVSAAETLKLLRHFTYEETPEPLRQWARQTLADEIAAGRLPLPTEDYQLWHLDSYCDKRSAPLVAQLARSAEDGGSTLGPCLAALGRWDPRIALEVALDTIGKAATHMACLDALDRKLWEPIPPFCRELVGKLAEIILTPETPSSASGYLFVLRHGDALAKKEVYRRIPELTPQQAAHLLRYTFGISVTDVVETMLRLKMIPAMPAAESIRSASEAVQYRHALDPLYGLEVILEKLGLMVWTDWEMDEAPIPYHELLMECAALTQGTFCPSAPSLWTFQPGTGLSEYRRGADAYVFRFIANERVVEFSMYDMGGWIDMTRWLNGLNQTLELLGITHRFLQAPCLFDDAIAFARPDAMEVLCNHFYRSQQESDRPHAADKPLKEQYWARPFLTRLKLMDA